MYRTSCRSRVDNVEVNDVWTNNFLQFTHQLNINIIQTTLIRTSVTPLQFESLNNVAVMHRLCVVQWAFTVLLEGICTMMPAKLSLKIGNGRPRAFSKIMSVNHDVRLSCIQ